MKKVFAIIAVLLLPFTGWSQAQINTKKVKISDFTKKTTKIVLTGNMFFDASLKDDVQAMWRTTPYEFCTMAEFNTLKGNDNYYFLIPTKGQFKNESEPGLMFLSLLKGGKNAANGIDEMLEIVSLPISSADDPSGRELVFLPAFLHIIQNYALDSMDKDINAYTGLANYTMNIVKAADMRLIFAEEDLSSEINEQVRKTWFNDDVLVLEADDADEYLTPDTENTLISYVAVPTEAAPGSYCYKMLIDPQTNKLYYYRKHKISKKVGAGFLAEDIKRITASRKK